MSAAAGPIRCVLALGNPGRAYALTRHSVALILMESIMRQCGAGDIQLPVATVHREAGGGDGWKPLGNVAEWTSVRFASPLGPNPTRWEPLTIPFVRSTTFMNLSGSIVPHLKKNFGISMEHLLVLHDDLERDLGRVVYRFGGGMAGHNGLRSLNSNGGSNFHRLRIGIGRPGPDSPTGIADYVLNRFTPAESDALEANVFPTALQVLARSLLVTHGLGPTNDASAPGAAQKRNSDRNPQQNQRKRSMPTTSAAIATTTKRATTTTTRLGGEGDSGVQCPPPLSVESLDHCKVL